MTEETQEQPKEQTEEKGKGSMIFSLRTTANREDQVVDFLAANAKKRKLDIYSIIRPHGMRSYIFLESSSRVEAETAAFEVPYARGVLPEAVPYEEIEHMVETVKKEVNIQKGDIAEIISGPFKREKCKITKVDKEKEEVVVELLEAAVPIPITLKMDSLKVIRRDEGE
jgi:transcriptional antiterminator NusG